MQYQIFLQELMAFLLYNDGMRAANRVPGGRKSLPFLCFLINIDELWLYQYHERSYGRIMEALFINIQRLENEKWNLIEGHTTDLLYEKIGTSKEEIFGFIDTKANYTSARFLEMEGRG